MSDLNLIDTDGRWPMANKPDPSKLSKDALMFLIALEISYPYPATELELDSIIDRMGLKSKSKAQLLRMRDTQ